MDENGRTAKKKGDKMRKIFQNWNYKKHAKTVSTIYLICYVIDMTLGYFLIKKTAEKKLCLKKNR